MRISRARVGFQIVLHVVLVGHVLAYYFLDWKRIGAIDFQAFFHYFLGDGLLTAGAIFAIAMFGGALVFGRLFCSWGCHFGAVQDLAAWLLRKAGWKPPLVRTRFLHQTPYLVLLAVFILPLLDHWRVSAWGPVEVDLAAVAPWDTLPGAALSAITFAACGAGILLFLGTRGFCRFVCPYGAIFRLTDRVAPFRVRKVAACGSGCGPEGVHPCTRACPTAIDVHAETEAFGSVASADCVRCHLCIEACPSQALAHVTRRRALARRRVVPAILPRDEPPPPRLARVYDLPFRGEAVVLAVAVATYLAVDMVYGAHFLAATIALGEGFLAFTVLRAITGSGATVLGRPLRSGGRWTLAGVTVAGVLVLSAVPIVQAGAFKWLRREGIRLDPHGRLESAAAPGDSPFSLPAASLPLDPPSRARLETAAEHYRMAVALFPSRVDARRLLLSAYARLGDPRAAGEAAEIARRSPPGDPWAEEALRWVRRRFGVLPQGRLPEEQGNGADPK
jgi:polyferredoxin